MPKLLLTSFTILLLLTTLTTQSQTIKHSKEVRKEKKESKRDIKEKNEEENEEYDNPMIREQQAADMIKDPALGYVPYQRLQTAIDYTEALKSAAKATSASNSDAIGIQSSTNFVNAQSTPLPWIERGPIYDSVGPSNGNTRGGPNTLGGHTSGRMRAFLLDTLNDPSGNTAFVGGVAGGIWKCTNFLSAVNNWTVVNDRFDNIAISSICQDPTNPQVIYFATGEPTSNADAVFGGGVWKSTNGGASFSLLISTINYKRTFKIGCDAAGNVYLACRTTTVPVSQANGLYRSTNGGTSWTNITPNNLTTNNSCTDFEFTASGILNATFGYLGTIVNHRYSTTPATVAVGSWSVSAGFRTSNTGAVRTEMAVSGDIIYAVTINSAYNVDSCYKSIDGGINWTKQNNLTIPTGLGSGQGWYSVTLAVNPLNTNEIICGGLDAYRSLDGGATFVRSTFWVTTSPYVHADHHFAYYWISGAQVRLILGTDGGIFYSNDNGITYTSKNRNIAIKQFYSAAIHPAAGSPYLLAGAQDNGTHSLSNPGLSYSIEVTGGDGCIVHINQQNPQIQYGSYVYNQYRRSVNGGATWASINLSGSTGQFINPFDYDDAQNIMYCGNSAGTIRRWDNANTSGTSIVFNVSNMSGSLLSAKYSPYTSNRLFFGTNNGKLYRLDDANVPANAASVTAVDITGSSFPSGTIICVNTGTNDNNLVATYSNYGVNNVWVSSDAGANWSAIDGNLPDMPVRWAMFEPNDNSKLFLATEAGIYTTTNINGSSTQWLPETSFPTVATYMLKMRASDSTIVAGTHGRGLWTAKIPPVVTANPSVTINQAATQADPTSVSPINFTIVFSEPVTGFTAAGVTLAGTAGATNKVVTGSGATYNVAVSGMTSSGTVIAVIPANVATGTINVSGNTASTSTDNTVTYNLPVVTPPTVTINQAATQTDPTSVSPINFTIVFSEPVTGFTAAGITLAGTAGATNKVVTGTGATYNVAVSGMTSSGTVIAVIPANVATGTINVTGNAASTSTDNTVTYNVTVVTAPSVTINQAATQVDPTSASPINFTIVFSEPMTGFTAAGITLSGTAGANTKVLTGTGATYNVAVSGMATSGTVIATVPANVATGTVNVTGNAASTSADNTVTYIVPVGCTSVNSVPNDTVCNGSIHPPVTFTSPTPGTVFNWINSTPSIGLGASGTGNIPTFTATNGTNTPVVATITVTPSLSSSTTPIPEILYYKFDGSGTTVPNLATAPPAGTATATIVGNQTQSGVGQCGTALESTGGTTNFLNTGWVTSLNGPFTISFWLGENQVNNNPSYLFGDVTAGAFRAFYGGAALPNNILLRGGSGDVLITGVNPSATLVTIVYNGTNTLVYKDGVLAQTYAVTFAVNGTGPFKVGGYGTGANNSYTGKLDEFRLYNRALSAAEVGTLTNCISGCTGTAKTFTISVNPTATVTAVSNQVVCNNASTTAVNFTSPTTGGTIVYNWTNNAPGIGLAATGTGNIASFVATNTGATPITATITVTPTFTNGSVSCAGTARTFTITVNPTPTVNAVADQTVCVGASTTPITFSGAVTGTVYTWTNSNPAIGLGASGTGNIPSFVATNGTTGAIAGTITVTPSFGTSPNICSGTARTFTITVNPLPTLTCPGNISVPSTLGLCSAPVTYTATATGTPTPVVTYTFSGATTGSGTGTGSGALFNVGVTSVTISATNSCAVRTCSFTVTVLDGQIPVITVQPVTKTFCESTTATFSVIATNAISYQWEMYNGSAWVPVAGATSATLTINNITQALNTNTYRVKVIGLCTSVTSTNATLYVDPKPVVSIVSTQSVLVPGSGFTLTAVTSGSGAGSYVWYRNGVVIPGVTGNILTGGRIDDRATYKVTYTNLNGCTNTSADFIVGTLQTTQIFVYPNPSRGVFQIRFYNLPNEQATVYIYNAAGQIVFKRIIPTGTLPYSQMPVNISNMAGGTYIIKLIDGAGKELGNTKIIKQ